MKGSLNYSKVQIQHTGLETDKHLLEGKMKKQAQGQIPFSHSTKPMRHIKTHDRPWD